MAISGESAEFFTAGVNGKNTAGGTAIEGRTGSTPTQAQLQAAGVVGINEGAGYGVLGINNGDTDNSEAVGVKGSGKTGVLGSGNFAVGIGIHGKGGRLAGFFEGDVEVTGDIRLTNADCAEDFDIVCVEKVEPGTVMVIDSEGALRPSDKAYDKRVAGVISGAGNYKPGLILDKRQDSSSNRMPISLMGKVYCKVDASYGAIEIGDLLTTSPTPGHAMKADNPIKAFGAVIGKALQVHKQGQGLVPILVCLQ